MNAKIIHVYEHSVEYQYREKLLLRYIYAPKTALWESPKPYFHPLRTLGGNEVTLFRPHDHVWHKGLAMTSAHLSGHNFWGGGTYVHGQGYIPVENHGRMLHQEWAEIRADEHAVFMQERLHWVGAHEGVLLAEERDIRVDEIDLAEGYWSLDLLFRLRNVTEGPLIFGSPTTKGRPMAGYGSLFWRGPRSFLGGSIIAADGLEGPEVMGKPAPWLAYVGKHDGNDLSSTLLFLDHPENPRYPNKWFVRNNPYACVSCSFMFDEEYLLDRGRELSLQYRVVLADGAWSRERIDEYVRSCQRIRGSD